MTWISNITYITLKHVLEYTLVQGKDSTSKDQTLGDSIIRWAMETYKQRAHTLQCFTKDNLQVFT